MESRLGLGWKSPLLLCWWEEGLIKAAKALFTRSPSTVPILTNEFVIADLLACNRCEWYDTVAWLLLLRLLTFLCKLQRNDPGCVVGEHIHVFFWPENSRFCPWFLCCTAIERPGDDWRSNENLTDGDRDPRRLTRVGDSDLVVNPAGREEKLDIDEAKADEVDDEIDEEQNLPEGEIDLWNWFDLFLDVDDSIVEPREGEF